MSIVSYPSELPCPASVQTTPAERRLLSDLPGPRNERALQGDYLATERATWPVLTQAQAERWRDWWRDELREGGAWFAADWPTPQGGRVARRFSSVPRWDYVHGGTDRRMWRVTAECEVRGRGAV